MQFTFTCGCPFWAVTFPPSLPFFWWAYAPLYRIAEKWSQAGHVRTSWGGSRCSVIWPVVNRPTHSPQTGCWMIRRMWNRYKKFPFSSRLQKRLLLVSSIKVLLLQDVLLEGRIYRRALCQVPVAVCRLKMLLPTCSLRSECSSPSNPGCSRSLGICSEAGRSPRQAQGQGQETWSSSRSVGPDARAEPEPPELSVAWVHQATRGWPWREISVCDRQQRQQDPVSLSRVAVGQDLEEACDTLSPASTMP